jgi:hypothetical protein
MEVSLDTIATFALFAHCNELYIIEGEVGGA